MYALHYDPRYEDQWSDYINWFTIGEVRDAIDKLNEKRGDGPMQIPTNFVKFHADTLTPIIQNMFNGVLQTGIVPPSWKLSYYHAIPKKGSRTDAKNYRGIAIQSVIPKLFDALLTSKLFEHTKNIIPTSQHGFMPGRSTTTNLLETSNYIYQQFAAGNEVDVIYFDFSKAFDCVNHELLARKLASMSIPFLLFKSILSFISGREYQMKFQDEFYGDPFHTTAGVPQGSHIGPLLFNIFCSDLSELTLGSSVKNVTYADDAKFMRGVNNNADRLELQDRIDALVSWSERNMLQLNAKKTRHVHFSKRRIVQYHSC